ncbi:beta strand repeat-containing protein [Bythopirellula goksoeyrii]|uniref:Autotransporter-associated beta strand repeat protein n=1 Tax=Bythopirellula goksoeyrii TaxID=1400387 RepID=A0A5B9Q9X3_9BACT|nr:autotransporter-associated beta strand repeat-containing protein [Bythopirellula goksoeyrii]QEG35777.1 Autotransporter-associated beta strand repeat protein [Bythopirellula goksoeyrii]
MSSIKKTVSIVSLGLLIHFGSSPAFSQLTEFSWNGSTGAQNWQQNGNWDMANFPNGPQQVANLAVPLAGNLTLNLGSTGNNVTAAGVYFGSTTGARTTDIISSGAILRLQNDFSQPLGNADFNKNSHVDGGDFLNWQRGYGITNPVPTNATGDANGDLAVNGIDLGIWQDNYGLSATGIEGGRSILNSGGLAGSVNRISAPVRLVAENVDVIGTTDLIIQGGLSYEQETSVEGTPSASFNNIANITTTINGNINLNNQFTGMRGDFALNQSDGSQGTLIINAVIDDGANDSDLFIGAPTNSVKLPLSTVRLNQANTYSGGTILRRANIEIANDGAFGTGPMRQQGPANQYGYNIIAIGGDRTIANDMTMAQWQTFKGSNSITLSGAITQTNSRGMINLLDAGKTLTLTGQLDIWEDDEALDRRFSFDGTGTTVFAGIIRDDPLFSGQVRQIHKTGTGVLLIDVGPGDNQHSGDTIIEMGNLHYADNDSLNTGPGLISGRGGAVGVDTGIANNTTFFNKISPGSRGGLMLAPSDAAANLNFTSFPYSNAGSMTVAAPETGLTYTGMITPANSTYGLGGGSGTLTLPNAQLVGSNSLEVRNGGTVELLGDNTYSGKTTIITKYTDTAQQQAAADSRGGADGLFYDTLVSPTLVVDDLANGGVASSIGSASADASNLFIQGSTLKYVGTGDSTNRLFTIGTGGATIDSSGTGAVAFTNAGLLGRDDAETRTGTLDDFSGQPNVIIEVSDTSDIVIGMAVSDPSPGGTFTQAPCNPDGSHCIPADTEVTGVTSSSIGLSNSFPFILKENTDIVFGTVERTLTLAGSNSNNNTIASVISDSDAGGVVAIDKTGPGKWVLSGSNTYSGDTAVEAGILSITNAFLDDDSAVRLAGGVLDLNFAGTDVIGDLFFNGVEQSNGIWGSLTSTATNKSAFFTGNGLLNVGGGALGALAAVPEPNAFVLATIASLALAGVRRRSLHAMG